MKCGVIRSESLVLNLNIEVNGYELKTPNPELCL